jgi:hypothetical protein
MPIKVPTKPVPLELQSLSFEQVGRRWKTRTSIARGTLQRAGIATVYVAQHPVEGVRMVDLLRYEDQLRQTISQKEEEAIA